MRARCSASPRTRGLAATLVAAAVGLLVPGQAAADPATVTYEVTSNSGKAFKVMYVAVTNADDLNRTHESATNETVRSPWRKDVTLSLGADYAMVMVMSDPANIDPTAQFSCRISVGFQQIDAASAQGMVGCAGQKVKERPRNR
ncbi:MAG: photosystem I reaction center subunit III protein [Segniliparus sp.]|uniref:photosystem I reaction center subunit III protein n=1 Tax=Segniliparus sp. TaxID=2804064 RepID=UPI003F32079C